MIRCLNRFHGVTELVVFSRVLLLNTKIRRMKFEVIATAYGNKTSSSVDVNVMFLLYIG